MKLSLDQISQATAGTLTGPSGSPTVSGYSIDTRTLAAGQLFFAILGENFDGHAFVEAAFQKGAVAAVVTTSAAASLASCGPLIVVPDTLVALQQLGAWVRRQWKGTVIGVTGSAGKTTTKEAIAHVLASHFPVFASRGNFNNHIGLPLQLLNLEATHTYAIMEMGMSSSGEITELCRIARPDWGVITNVGTAHMQNFPDGQAGVAAAKRELIEALPPSGIAFLNADDAWAAHFGSAFQGSSVLYGTSPQADPWAENIQESASGVGFDVCTGGQRIPAHIQLLGRHNVLNSLAALAVGIHAGIRLEDAVAALATLTPPDKRGQVLHLNGATLINDCYNSNPEALSSMIHTLAGMPATRHILVAGEMLELGPHAAELHRTAGSLAAQQGIDIVLGIRGNGRAIAEGAQQHGAQSLYLETPAEAGDWLLHNLRSGDVVLLKASRGVKLEQALTPLTAPQI